MTGIIQFSNVSKIFPPNVTCLEDLTFDVHDREFIALVGPCGCGKSVILRMIAGLDSPTGGDVLYKGKPIRGTDHRRALVFQETLLYPWMTILDNVMFGPLSRGMKKENVREKAIEWINFMGLKMYPNSYPYELSGGLQRRAFLARILVNEPEVVLFDEPFGGLDWFTREIIANQVLRIWYEQKFTFIYVTHAVEEAVRLAQKVYVMTNCPSKIKEIIKIDLPEKRWELGEELLVDKKYAGYVEKIRAMF